METKFKKLITTILTICSFFSFSSSFAQFATGGTGLYQKQIYWLSWEISSDTSTGLQTIKTKKPNPNSQQDTIYSKDRPIKGDTIPQGTYTWKINDNIRVVGELKYVSKTKTPTRGTINSYNKSGLQRMYTGLENKKMTIHTQDATTVTLDIELDFQIYNNGMWNTVDPANHGIVFADAESVADYPNEEISAWVPHTTDWYIIDRAQKNFDGNTNWLSNYKIYNDTVTVNDTIKYKRMRIVNESNQQDGAAVVMYGKGINKIKNLLIKGWGYTDVMIGYFINNDPSNAQIKAQAMHYQDILISSEGGTFYTLKSEEIYKNITQLSIPMVEVSTNTYIGNRPNVQEPFSDSLSNQDAIIQIGKYYAGMPTGTIKYEVTVTNNYNVPAYLYSFLDMNNDSTFTNNEAANVITIPPNVTDYKVTVEFNSNFLLGLSDATTLTCRFRITTDTLIDNVATANIDERSMGFARNGEVSDILLKILPFDQYEPEPLPLSLIYFNGYEQKNGKNLLNWETADEQNIKHFELQKSTNAKDFSTIAIIDAKNDWQSYYELLDNSVHQKTNYYRLKIVEKDPKVYNFSPIVVINNNNFSKIIDDIRIAPNPATDAI